MNELLKYKAWDIQYKKVVTVTMLLLETEELDHDDNNNEPKHFDHFEIMEWTYRNDKKGGGIYTGHIIRLINTNRIGLVKREEQYLNAWEIGAKADDLLGYKSEMIEIIGNKWQNLELLKMIEND